MNRPNIPVVQYFRFMGILIIFQQDKTTEEKETSEGKVTEAKADEEKEEGSTMDTATSEETVASAGGTDSSMVVGEEYNKMVQNIVDMGYEKAQVIASKILGAVVLYDIKPEYVK